jgi:hypothetical protein
MDHPLLVRNLSFLIKIAATLARDAPTTARKLSWNPKVFLGKVVSFLWDFRGSPRQWVIHMIKEFEWSVHVMGWILWK